MAQMVITISGSASRQKDAIFSCIHQSLEKAKSHHRIFAFDGEGRRMTVDDRDKMAKADIVILTKQNYKKRRIKKRK